MYKNINVIIVNWFDSIKITLGVVGIFTTIFNYWRKFNLFITKIWIILTNSTAKWNVSSNFEGDFSKKQFQDLVKEIKKEESVSDYYEISDTVIRININGLNYSLEYVDIENEENTGTLGKLYCNIIDFHSSYDHSIKVLEENIVPYFSIIDKRLKPDHSTFTFKISFKGKNPFIRLITKNVNVKTVNSLWYSVREDTRAGRRDIKISDKTIECTTSNITDFQLSSINFISLVGE